MSTSIERITTLEGKVNTVLKTGLTFASASQLTTIGVFFLTDLLFRSIVLGRRIKEKVRAQVGALDEAVKAEGLIDVPVQVDTFPIEMRQFYRFRVRLLFPNFSTLFKEELAIYNQGNTEDPNYQDAFDILKYAYIYAFDYQKNGHLNSSPLLDDIICKMQTVKNPNYREVVLQIKEHLDENGHSLKGHFSRIPLYSRMLLQLYAQDLSQIKEDHLFELQQEISDLVRGAVLNDPDNVTDKTLKFLVDRRTQLLDQQIQEIQKEINQLGEGTGDIDHTAEITALRARSEELEQRKTSIQELS